MTEKASLSSKTAAWRAPKVVPKPTPKGEESPSGNVRRCTTCGERYPLSFKVCPQDATPLEIISQDGGDPLIGEVFGDCYRIARVLGQGGTARVYEAVHTRLSKKRFAVKLLLPEHAVKENLVKRFEREAEAASRVQHPNVLDVLDVHRTRSGTPYIVAEYLDGEELGNLLDRVGKLAPSAAVRVARQVCQGLSASHAAGIVHRDMKPENVFLVGDPTNPIAKVIDFGISKLVNETEDDKLTRTGSIMGTPIYMPPEQARGAKVDHRADVYGVGAILYRALTGAKPFPQKEALRVLAAVINDEPPRPRTVEPGVPEALELVIERAMAKDPDDRYATVAAMDADLAAYERAAGEPDSVAEPVNGFPAFQKREHKDDDDSDEARLRLSLRPALSEEASDSRRARPTIGLLTVVCYLWLLTGFVEVLSTVVRGLDATLTRTELWLSLGGILATTLTPTIFWIRYLMRRVWQHSVRALELAKGMRRFVGVGIATYGVSVLFLRLVDGVVGMEKVNPPHYLQVIPFGLSLVVALCAWLWLVLERRRR